MYDFLFKCYDKYGQMIAHPCHGQFVLCEKGEMANAVNGSPVVWDKGKSLHFSVDEFPHIYIENAAGKTVASIHARDKDIG